MRRSVLLSQVMLLMVILAVTANVALADSLLSLSSASTLPNGTVSLSLSLTSPSGSEPASLQWTLNYSPANVTGISVTGGPALASAGKSITCAQNLGGYSCLARGLNNGIYNGIVAEVVVSISTPLDAVSIGLSNALGASPSAVAIPVIATGGSISVIPPLTLPTNLTISGQVTASGMGLSRVTINVNGSQTTSTTTDASGNYSLTLGVNGTYTLSAALAGYSFSAPVTFSDLGSNQTANFAGIAVAGLEFFPVTPCRLADTRVSSFQSGFGPPSMTAGQTRTFAIPSNSACGIPSTAAAYSLNVTVVTQGYLGFLTIWPAGQSMPNVSTLNSYSNSSTTVANAAIVPAGTNGAINIYVTDATDVILDINGYFALPLSTGLEFYPVTPCRLVDTRVATFQSGFGPPSMTAGMVRTFPIPSNSACGIPATASAYSLNVTAVPQETLGFLSIWPTGQPLPNVSTLNVYNAGTVVANAAIVPAGTNGAVNTYVTDATDLVIDIDGYFGPATANGLSFYPATPCRVADTRVASFPSNLGPPSMGAGTQRSFPVTAGTCGIPYGAGAYSFNFTAVPHAPQLRIFIAWPTGVAEPNVSTMNSYNGSVVANAAIVQAGVNGAISIFVTDLSDVFFDVNGYFAP